MPQISRPAEARFLVDLGRALHRFGAPANRIEDALHRAAHRLGIEARFFSAPTAIMAAFGPEEAQRTALLRVEPGEEDLGRLDAIYALIEEIEEGQPSNRWHARLRAILEAPDRYRPITLTLAHAVAAGSAGLFLGGGWIDAAVATAIGAYLGTLGRWLPSAPQWRGVFVLIAATSASLLAGLAAIALSSAGRGSLTPELATLAGLIVFLPGLSLTLGISEIATRHLVSGTARLTHAGVVLLMMLFGVRLGEQLWRPWLEGIPGEAAVVAPSEWMLALALLAMAPALTILFQVPPRSMPWVLLACLLAYFGARVGNDWLGPDLGASVGAFLIGAGSNLRARWSQRPAAVTLVPGMLLLVPGSLGYRSVFSLMEHDTLAGLDLGFRMAMVAISIVAGLLVANALVPPGQGRVSALREAEFENECEPEAYPEVST